MCVEGWKGGREARVRRLIGGTRATELYSWCPVIETHRIEFVTDQQGGGQPVGGEGDIAVSGQGMSVAAGEQQGSTNGH